jgi:hypothetical protein
MKKDEERYLKDGTEKKYCSHIHHQIGEIDYYYPFGG